MPDTTYNTLEIFGEEDGLRYFYEKNKISKDDEKFLDINQERIEDESDECVLSFSKSVPRDIDVILIKNIENEKKCKLTDKEKWEVRCSIWGTKIDAIEPKVDLSEIKEGKITYYFDTAWCYPYNWLKIVSAMYHTLEFRIKHINECENFNTEHHHKYKKGIEIEYSKNTLN